jgi:hypothetical protein|tara:strand:- start:634 stop:990 length:357 start_codon:yes stop_codon:yes gene_type:complete
MSEDKLQSAIVKYIQYKYPNVKYCSSIAGAYISSRVQRAKIVRNGYVRGKNDLDIFEARGGYFALMLELKEKAYPTKEQKEWIEAMNQRGYCALVTRGLDETIDVIDEYLSKERTRTI